MQKVRVAKRHQVKHRRRAPEPRPRDLKKKNQLGSPSALLLQSYTVGIQRWQAWLQIRDSLFL
jgi:hypothetical protein